MSIKKNECIVQWVSTLKDMGRRIFENYWKGRYADAPDGEPGNDGNVPYDHLMKYNGKEVGYSFVDMPAGIACGGKGILTVKPGLLSVKSDTGHLHLSSEVVGRIQWHEDSKTYDMFNGKLSIRPN